MSVNAEGMMGKEKFNQRAEGNRKEELLEMGMHGQFVRNAQGIKKNIAS